MSIEQLNKIQFAAKKIYTDRSAAQERVYEVFKDFFGEDFVDFIPCDLNKLGQKVYCNLSSSWLSNLNTYKDETIEKKVKAAILDLQDNSYDNRSYLLSTIIVWFPEITVTNEYDRSTNVKDLFVKIPLNMDGSLNARFQIARTTYTISHLMSGYRHSHTPTINGISNVLEFVSPCTGTGPINGTMYSLEEDEFEEELWGLFCLELDKYVRVESVQGVPYIKLESISKRKRYENIDFSYYTNRRPNYNQAFENLLNDFAIYYVKYNELPFNYINSNYTLAEDASTFAIKVSNAFIQWYNVKYKEGFYLFNLDELLCSSILMKCNKKNGILVKEIGRGFDTSSLHDRYLQYKNQVVFSFKGREIRFKVIDDVGVNAEEDSSILLLNPNFISYFINRILKIVNYGFSSETPSLSEAGRYL